MVNKKNFVAVVGLGYVGLPISLALGKKIPTIGFDISRGRIKELKKNFDRTFEKTKKEISSVKKIIFTNSPSLLKQAHIYIVAVPTPINKTNNPNFKPLLNACKIISKYLKRGDIVIFESTVYPGVTRDICVPYLEKKSSLKHLVDFNVAYSPERANVGDKANNLRNVVKLVSADNYKTLFKVKSLYKLIVNKIFLTKSIEIAEAAKSLENTQRDINIAFMNEFSKICERLNLNTYDVIKAASTKWNFMNFTPGLVGGHCISVDPYYLKYGSEKKKYTPKIITYSRKINNSIPGHIVRKIFKSVNIKEKLNFLVLGLTFKENCNDIRSSKVFDLIKILRKRKNINIDLHDPYVINHEVKKSYNETPKLWDKVIRKKYDVVILAVKHIFYNANKDKIYKLIKNNGIFFDLKSFLVKDLKKNNKFLKIMTL